MKINIYSVEADPYTLLYEMNEAHFKFEPNLWSRFDCNGENNDAGLSEEQKTLVQKLTSLESDGEPVFKKVLFYRNEIWVYFLCKWTEELKEKTCNHIQWSWPTLFLNLNPDK